jgi:transposase
MAFRAQFDIGRREWSFERSATRGGTGSVVTWRRAQIVLLSAQRMSPAKVSEVVFTDPDTVREVIHNFNLDGFYALYPRYAGGRPPTFTLPQRREIKKIALSIPTDLGRPFATWSLAKLADYLVAEGVVTDISREGLRQLLREEGVSFQAVRTWKRSNDPNFEAKKNRILELYELADASKAVVTCLDEFGPLNLQPQPGGRAWAPLKKPRRIRATYTRPHGVRHMLGAYDVTRDRLYGHVKKRKTRVEFLAFCRYVRSLYPAKVRLHFVLDNFGPHLGARCATGPQTTTSSSPTRRTTAPGSTGPRRSSRRFATSRWTEPTILTTPPRRG